MSIKAGLVGLPNVGKSTLFNALTKSQVPAENYPFCTIDPHVAITEVPDERLDKLQKVYESTKQIPATVTFVDIAGLAQGAASGEGLGNQFLSHIQGVDLILHVLRCFDNSDIIATRGAIDPIGDFQIIVSELMLKDLESVTKRIEKVNGLIKRSQSKPKELKELTNEKELLEKLLTALDNADSEHVRTLIQNSPLSTIPLLCAKNFMIIANVGEDELEDDAYKKNSHYQSLVKKFGEKNVVAVSAKLEGELMQLNDDEAQEIMNMLGVKKRGLDDIIKTTYDNLGLITFFTCGPKETHAWPIPKGMTVKQAGGEIHSDIQRGFICAEIFNCKDLFEYGSENKVKEAGKMRIEGADYIVQDGDTLHIRFNV